MQLGVNIDHVATLREARKIDVPDPVLAAQIVLRAGCDSVVCHLREDRRHINDKDLEDLRKIVKTKLNLEMACAEEIVAIAVEVKPEQATLVPERRQEVTTEGGLDVAANLPAIKKVVQRLNSAGIKTSLFIDPDKLQIQAAVGAGVKYIELHTGEYANAKGAKQAQLELANLTTNAKFAKSAGLNVFAGHGLNYENVKEVVKIKEIEELNIGHSIISRAVFVGLENAVKEMICLLAVE